jgi:hypothetical protein
MGQHQNPLGACVGGAGSRASDASGASPSVCRVATGAVRSRLHERGASRRTSHVSCD